MRNLYLHSFLFTLFLLVYGDSESGAYASSNTLINNSADNQPVSEEVLGSDLDSDGIRDDLQMYIEKTYSENSQQMRAAKRMARADRQVLSVVHDIDALKDVADEAFKSTMCWLRAVKGDDPFREEADILIKEYSDMRRNSAARVHAELLVDMRLPEVQKSNYGNIWTIPCPL